MLSSGHSPEGATRNQPRPSHDSDSSHFGFGFVDNQSLWLWSSRRTQCWCRLTDKLSHGWRPSCMTWISERNIPFCNLAKENSIYTHYYTHYYTLKKTQKKTTDHWPDKIGDDEQLYNPVDDTHRPALYHHRFGGLVGEEISQEPPQNKAHCCSSVWPR